jgi:hypothetical protein
LNRKSVLGKLKGYVRFRSVISLDRSHIPKTKMKPRKRCEADFLTIIHPKFSQKLKYIS